jgi:ketosteroid isomerase-like protein
MKSARYMAIGVLLAAAHWGALPLCAQNPAAGSGVEAEILAAQAERDRVFVAGDAKAVEKFMADEYLQTDVNGKVQDKAAWLKEYLLPIVAKIKSGECRWDVYKRTEVQVRVFGDVAVVIGALELHGWSASGQNNDHPSRFLRFTRVWVKRGGAWKLAVVHNEWFTPTQP